LLTASRLRLSRSFLRIFATASESPSAAAIAASISNSLSSIAEIGLDGRLLVVVGVDADVFSEGVKGTGDDGLLDEDSFDLLGFTADETSSKSVTSSMVGAWDCRDFPPAESFFVLDVVFFGLATGVDWEAIRFLTAFVIPAASDP
jgi:hypothetical protein